MSPEPDRWLELEIEKPNDAERAGLLAEGLVDLTGRGIEERDGSLVAYLPGPVPDLDVFLSELARRWTGTRGVVLSTNWRAQEDWARIWRQGIAPRRVGYRIVVAPSWDVPATADPDILVSIDPGMAFGTAEHATTRGCLRLMEGRVRKGSRVADVGAGSGILSIAAALLGAERVLAIEMDEWASGVARENVDRNGVSDRVGIVSAEVDEQFLRREEPFDVIVANLESATVSRLLRGFRSALTDAGCLILSGLLAHESDEIRLRASDLQLSFDAEDREDGWWTGAFRPENPR